MLMTNMIWEVEGTFSILMDSSARSSAGVLEISIKGFLIAFLTCSLSMDAAATVLGVLRVLTIVDWVDST